MSFYDNLNLFVFFILLFPVFYFGKNKAQEAILTYRIKQTEKELSKAIMELEKLQQEAKNLK